MKSKKCSKCKKLKSVSNFHKHRAKKDGLQSRCKQCEIIYQQSNKRRTYQKKYRQNHKIEITEYRQNYKIEQAKYSKQYQQNHKVETTKRRQAYYKTLRGYLRYIFHSMQQRCNNSKLKQYKNYGDRGIKCLFKNVDEFIDYVINVLQTDPRGLQINRINNDSHYKPGNIRFVTAKVNANNRRNNIRNK